MDCEAPDGSQISCREIWKDRNGEHTFDYTTISAYIDGQPYVTKSNDHADEVDVVDALNTLEPVPLECIQPVMPDDVTLAAEVNLERHYLKAPSFTYDDCRSGTAFVADCVLNEIVVLEQLRQRPHKNIATYYGCVVKDGRISHVCLKRYVCNLPTYVEEDLRRGICVSDSHMHSWLRGIKAAIEHLHSLGLAHNDVNPDNICMDENGQVVLVDFDSCLPFGQNLMKGVAGNMTSDQDAAVSSRENDYCGLEAIEDFLRYKYGLDDYSDAEDISV